MIGSQFVSSQVNELRLRMTGMGFPDNSINEILNQVYSVPDSEKITNLVFILAGRLTL